MVEKKLAKAVVEVKKEVGNFEIETGFARVIFEKEKGGLLLRLPKEDAIKVRRIMQLETSDRCVVLISPRELVFQKNSVARVG